MYFEEIKLNVFNVYDEGLGMWLKMFLLWEFYVLDVRLCVVFI